MPVFDARKLAGPKVKPIAILMVVTDGDEGNGPSGLVTIRKGVYVLRMSPDDAGPIMQATGGDEPTMRQVRTIMAHELGHFLAQVTNDPTHTRVNAERKLTRQPMAAAELVPGEENAWQYARQMYPDLDPRIESYALGGYKEAAERGETE